MGKLYTLWVDEGGDRDCGGKGIKGIVMKREPKDLIVEKTEWGRYVSPLSDNNNAPFNWYSFKHRFGSELVSNIFTMFNLSKGDTVFDPFCGGGTTLIKAKMDGYNAYGLDISPFSIFLTNVLTKKHDINEIKRAMNSISHKNDKTSDVPDVGIIKKAFSDLTLKYIFSLCSSIKLLNSPAKDFLLFSLLSILNDASKAKKSGGFLRITDQRKTTANQVKMLFLNNVLKFSNEINLFHYQDVISIASLGDARDYPAEIIDNQYDAILTSPPYPNRHDYTRIYELELLVGFINNNNDLKKLRYDTLRSHVEAKKKYKATNYIVPSLLQKQINKIDEDELNNGNVISTLYGYFEDMYLSLREMHRVLKRDKYIGLVVSNVRFAGIMIPVDEILCEIGEQVGLKAHKIYVLRYRGNSSQQMSKYDRVPSRESLIIWQK